MATLAVAWLSHYPVEWLATSPVFADGERQAVRVCVLCESSAEEFFGFLNARHIIGDHSRMEFIEVRHADAGSATAGGFELLAFVSVTWSIAQMQSEGCALGCEFGPMGRFELQGKADDVSIERD